MPPRAPRPRRARARLSLALLAGLLAVAGCSAARPIEVPSTLPNVTRQEFLTLRWALLRRDGVARAVGVAESSRGVRWDATLELLGVDGAGRTLSRGSAIVRPGFAPGPVAFETTLVETGRESEFRLHVVHVQEYSRPSR